MQEKTKRNKTLLSTCIGCAVMVFLTIHPHSGFMVIFFLIFLVPSLLYRTLRCIKFHDERKVTGLRTLAWVLSLAIIITTHYIRHITVRENANEILALVLEYKDRHKKYPENLETLGIPYKGSKNPYRIYYDPGNDNEPFMFYRATWIVFDTYHYDFESGKWIYRQS